MTSSRTKSWKSRTTFKNLAIARFFTSGLGNCNLCADYFVTSDYDFTTSINNDNN